MVSRKLQAPMLASYTVSCFMSCSGDVRKKAELSGPTFIRLMWGPGNLKLVKQPMTKRGVKGSTYLYTRLLDRNTAPLQAGDGDFRPPTEFSNFTWRRVEK